MGVALARKWKGRAKGHPRVDKPPVTEIAQHRIQAAAGERPRSAGVEPGEVRVVQRRQRGEHLQCDDLRADQAVDIGGDGAGKLEGTLLVPRALGRRVDVEH
jgi:hypothetical protein